MNQPVLLVYLLDNAEELLEYGSGEYNHEYERALVELISDTTENEFHKVASMLGARVGRKMPHET